MYTTRFAGRPGRDDFADPSSYDDRAASAYDVPNRQWTWLHQVHGSDVVTVRRPGEHAGATADAAVTTVRGAVLAIRTADCAAVIAVDAANGVLGVAHAGWRGLVAGVLEAMIDQMRRLGAAESITADVQPHIRARCYEFGAVDLDLAASQLGDEVRATTAWGTPALDVTAGVCTTLDRLDVEATVAAGCTACEPQRFFSHRARGDAGRHATLAWLS